DSIQRRASIAITPVDGPRCARCPPRWALAYPPPSGGHPELAVQPETTRTCGLTPLCPPGSVDCVTVGLRYGREELAGTTCGTVAEQVTCPAVRSHSGAGGSRVAYEVQSDHRRPAEARRLNQVHRVRGSPAGREPARQPRDDAVHRPRTW